jgi:response regulator RpfG family c-di-GMP phosphodiesterase
MSAQQKQRVLCVDDEPLVLEGLRHTLRRRFDVVTAPGGAEGLRAIEAGPPFAVVVSDMRMPGMNGAEFLARVRTACPDSVRVLLTGHADFDAALAAVNHGQIFRFLTKPCPADVMLATLEAAAEQNRLIHSERVLLEQTLTGAVKALADILALSSPVAFGRAARLHRTVSAVAERLAIRDRWPVEVAAQLSQLGCLQLPDAVAEKLYRGLPLGPAEQAEADRVPALADQLLAHIPRLEPVREILANQRRSWDGAGDPFGRMRGEAIPVGARLLRLAVDLDTLQASGLTGPQALAALQARAGAYDPRLLEALAEIVGEETACAVQELALVALQPGMVLATDVVSGTGVLLVARGYTVSQSLLVRLQALGNVREPVRVLAAKPPAAGRTATG